MERWNINYRTTTTKVEKMKASEFRKLIREEVRNAVKEVAATPALKPLDFNKLDQIHTLLSTPHPDLKNQGYGETISGYKKDDFSDEPKALKKFAKAHAKGYSELADLIADNSEMFAFGTFEEDDRPDFLKDKKLAKYLREYEDAWSDINLYAQDIDIDNTIKAYNKFADVVAKFGAQTTTLSEAPMTAPTTYDYNNPGDEWKAILTKAMQRFNAYSNNTKVKKDTANLLMAIYKLGAKKIGKNLKPDDLESLAKVTILHGTMQGSVDDLIAYIKDNLDPTAFPRWGDVRAKKPFKAGKWVRITPQTKLKIGDELVRMGGLDFADIVKIEGTNYLLHFDADYADDKPTKTPRKSLEDYWLLIQKK